MKADILQILHEEATTRYNSDSDDERVINSDEFDTVANQIINLFNNQWISVNDKLPLKDKNNDIECLCFDEYHNQVRVLVFNVYHNCWDDESGDDYYTDAIGGKVTHWMPLPNKPILTSEK